MSTAMSLTGAQGHRRPRAAWSGRTLVVLLALVGGAVALVGVALPWLSFYAGLHTIAGIDGAFGSAAGVIAASGIACALAFAMSGGHVARWLIGLAGFGTVAIAGWSGLNALATVRGLQDPLLVLEPGPGTLVLAVGGALMVATMFVPDAPADQRRAVSAGRLRAILTASLVAGGIIHLGVGQDHLNTSMLIGTAMIVGGAAQVAVAVAVRSRPASRLVLSSALGLSAVLIASYALAVTLGLPVEPHPHATIVAGHPSGGHVEPVSSVGLVTVGIEMLAVGIAAALLARHRHATVEQRLRGR
jgi:hypothetical protein